MSGNEVLIALKSVKPNVTDGPYHILAFLMLVCRYVLVAPLGFVFNLILKFQTLPNGEIEENIIGSLLTV